MTTTKTTKVAALAALALPLALGLAACDPDHSTNPPQDDIDQGWTCVDDGGVVRSTGSVTNHSSKPSFYLVTVTFSSNGDRIGSASTNVDRVEPDETAALSVSAEVASSGDIACEVSDVARFKA